ncbi:putative diguanylate cyclase [Acetobacter nitrogenifigens DSM 23921 = NBRC 105050]|uniref:Signal transduction histidine kinase n=1 Tax=Acetobacter nitrogenifigens DSM 23921 = NBRC 105050 TaxID=1120919 RepID=A0A511XA30_9PROT|nr:EAL domain-containing protein [Acetobacter nitrogenifigens]GBQ97838.1 putative diguanylate cyclase [Acetobacter nitrogenifigens DSM 23921 = NBRC 105050]GEN59782.1 signal transduction histidine kinase [Acetobacter nitrogenifigens DSM 23921 = NBRC 105050]
METDRKNDAAGEPDRRLERLAALAFAAADVLFEVDRALRIRHVGGAAVRLTGHKPKSLKNLSLFDLVSPSDRLLLRRAIEEFEEKGAIARLTLRFLRPNDASVTAILGLAALPGAPGERLVTATIVDRSFVACADQDGLMSRSSFLDFAKRLVSQPGEATRYRVVMLALPDLVRSATLRQTGIGKAFQGEVEAILRMHAEGGGVTRLSDGSFAYVATSEDSERIVERKIQEVTESLLASVRIRDLPLDSSLMEQKEVETAMDFALSAFNEDIADAFSFKSLPECLAAASRNDRGLASSCRNIIEDETFFQVLQPVIAFKTGHVQHYEVLTRFAEGVARGLANTSEFVKVAERIGMINTFDLLNCVKTLKLLEKLPAGVKLALNLSGRSMQSPEFGERLLNVLDSESRNVAASRLLIEITETSGIVDFDAPTELVRKLHARGHHICLDDFGAGAMSFEYLRRFPVSYIKIDGQFFRSAMSNSRDRILVRAIARCSFDVGCRTVAEMIETEMEAALARELGIECGQGWLFGRPVTADALLAASTKMPDIGTPATPLQQAATPVTNIQRQRRPATTADS